MRLRIAIAVLLVAALGCAVPPAATPTPTRLPVTPASADLTATLLPETTTQPSAAATSPRRTAQPDLPPHYISIRQVYGLAELYDTRSGQKLTPRGANYFSLVPVPGGYAERTLAVGVYNQAQVQADFQRLRAAGYNTVRMLLDDCSGGTGCLALESGQGLNPAYLDNIVEVMHLAKENDLLLLLASVDLPPGSSYAEQASQGSGNGVDGSRNTAFLTPQGVQAYRDYWGDLLGALAVREAPFEVVLGWELVAEQWYQGDQPPFSLEQGTLTAANGQTYDLAEARQKSTLGVDGMRYFSTALRQVIRAYDPTALVGMGFFVPAGPNPARQGDPRYVETAGLLADPVLDFFDLHMYPSGALSLADYAENFGLDGRTAAPLLMGEVGALSGFYQAVEAAATSMQDWVAASCAYGFDGWLYWGLAAAGSPEPEGVWGFGEAEGYLLEALSPHEQPDACTVSVLPGRNLALNRTVSASAALPAEPPELAVDGTSALWNAGAFAEQWLMVDLGAPATLGSIRLQVGQWPNGRTTHQLFAAGPDGAMRLLIEFNGYTQDFDWLEYAPPTPLQNIRYIRVVTLESPAWVAWREVEALAPGLPTPTPAGEP